MMLMHSLIHSILNFKAITVIYLANFDQISFKYPQNINIILCDINFTVIAAYYVVGIGNYCEKNNIIMHNIS